MLCRVIRWFLPERALQVVELALLFLQLLAQLAKLLVFRRIAAPDQRIRLCSRDELQALVGEPRRLPVQVQGLRGILGHAEAGLIEMSERGLGGSVPRRRSLGVPGGGGRIVGRSQLLIENAHIGLCRGIPGLGLREPQLDGVGVAARIEDRILPTPDGAVASRRPNEAPCHLIDHRRAELSHPTGKPAVNDGEVVSRGRSGRGALRESAARGRCEEEEQPQKTASHRAAGGCERARPCHIGLHHFTSALPKSDASGRDLGFGLHDPTPLLPFVVEK